MPLYPRYEQASLNQSANTNLMSGIVKMVLVNSGLYTYSDTHEFIEDVSNAARVGVSLALTGKSSTNGTFASEAIIFPALIALQVNAIILFIDTGNESTSRLVFFSNNVIGLPLIPALNDSATLNIGNYLFTTNTQDASSVTKESLGLDLVDNTADINKPISILNQLALDDKQDLLVSGQNIKSINNQSILGTGNLAITGGGAVVWGGITGTLSSQIDLQTDLNARATVISVSTVSNDLASLTTVVAGKQNALGFTAENVSNKAINLTNPDNIKYPTTQAVSSAISGFAPLASPTFTGTVSGITKGMIGLSLVENTALSTWTGSSFITTLGTIVTGTWNGTVIGDTYISSASVWNAKQNAIGFTPENVGNKATSLTSPDNTKYPTTLAISTALAGKSDTSHTHTLSAISNITATATEINYSAGVTSAIQTQLNAKQATLVSATNIKTINGNTLLGTGDLVISGGGVTAHNALTGLNADDHTQYSLANGSRWTATPTANRVVISDASGNIIVSSITTTILGYLSSVSSDIQIQLNGKATTTSVTTVSNDLSALTTVVAGKQNTLGFTPENISNKATNLTSPDNTKYPTTLAVSNAISGITKSTLGLSLVENTTLSTWAGSTNLATLGTIITGTWNGTAINDTYISSASVWNNKQNALVSGTTIKTVNSQSLLGSGDITISGSVAWGNVTGTLSSQADLLAALNAKQNTITNSDSIVQGTTNLFLTSSERTKLTGIQAGAEVNVNPDWNATSGDGQILNKPTTLAGYQISDAQPLDSDLTAIAALTTTSFGRGILTQADGAAIRTYIGASTSSFDGNYNSLSNIPTSFTPSSHNQAWTTITGTPTTLSGYGITDAQTFITAGTTAQYYRGDKTFQTLDKAAVGLALVENTALSTWIGSTNLTTLGTITGGIWNGTTISDAYISSASVWNNKQNALVSGTTIKTINNESLLGGGNLTITGGGGITNSQSIINSLIFG